MYLSELNDHHTVNSYRNVLHRNAKQPCCRGTLTAHDQLHLMTQETSLHLSPQHFVLSSLARHWAVPSLPPMSQTSDYTTKRCSAIAERPRCRVRYSFGQKWKTGTGRRDFTDIIHLSSTTVI